jgi:hypothetical protein
MAEEKRGGASSAGTHTREEACRERRHHVRMGLVAPFLHHVRQWPTMRRLNQYSVGEVCISYRSFSTPILGYAAAVGDSMTSGHHKQCGRFTHLMTTNL